MYQFALIGCGRISRRHAENIQRIGRLVAVCDIVPEKADILAKAYNCKAYYSIDELIRGEKELNIISVCTPNGFHAEHSIKSLQAGLHVLCEKPLCLTTAAAWQIIETEKFCRRHLFVVKSNRYNPILIQVKKLFDEGKLGKVYSFHLSCLWNRPFEYYQDWHGKTFPDGGTLYTQFSHYIDAMLWMFGDVKELNGFRKNLAHRGDIEFEDSGVVALEMNSGVLGGLNWSVNSYQKNMEVSLTILAEKGSIRIGGEYLNEIQYNISEEEIVNDGSAGAANDYGFYKGSMSNHDKVYENLVKALRHNGHPFTNAEDGLKTVEFIERVYKMVPLS